MAKPAQDSPSSAIDLSLAAQEPREERERRLACGATFAPLEALECVTEFIVSWRMLGECVAQRAFALPCQREQVVVVEAEQWAFQRDCKRQIVPRQQQRIRKVHQVDDRDVLGQLEAVSASHGNA